MTRLSAMVFVALFLVPGGCSGDDDSSPSDGGSSVDQDEIVLDCTPCTVDTDCTESISVCGEFKFSERIAHLCASKYVKNPGETPVTECCQGTSCAFYYYFPPSQEEDAGPPPSVAGTWEGTWGYQNGGTFKMVLSQQGYDVSGTAQVTSPARDCTADATVEGLIKDIELPSPGWWFEATLKRPGSNASFNFQHWDPTSSHVDGMMTGSTATSSECADLVVDDMREELDIDRTAP